MTKLLAGTLCGIIVCGSAGVAAAQAGREALVPMDVGASSTLKPKKDQYAAWRVFDHDDATGWCEGKKGAGVGEHLEISGIDVSFSRLTIEAGYWKSAKLFKANNRPTRLTVVVTDHEGNEISHDVVAADGMEPTELDLGQTVGAQSIRIVFAEVAKGKLDDTCITGVRLHDGDRSLRPWLDAPESIDDLAAAIDTVSRGLETCDAGLLDNFVKFPLAYKSLPDPDGASKPIKAKYKKVKDLVKACKQGKAPAPATDYDFGQVFVEGAGKVSFAVGAGNDVAIQVWHMVYDGGEMGGSWKLRAVDY